MRMIAAIAGMPRHTSDGYAVRPPCSRCGTRESTADLQPPSVSGMPREISIGNGTATRPRPLGHLGPPTRSPAPQLLAAVAITAIRARMGLR